MEKKDDFLFTTGVIGYPILFVLLIWIVYWFEIRFDISFNSFGVYPRTIKGLRGIIFSPFIHSDLKHLWNNTLPLLILSSALFYFYDKVAWKVLGLGLLLTGIMTWILGRPANHIGVSGVIYMLFGFLFFKGVVSKYYRLIALSFVVVFLYGSMMWYIFPIEKEISWEGHLSGLLIGVIFAFIFKQGIHLSKKYEWEREDYNEEEDEFLKHFDENGNFIEFKNDIETEIYEFNQTNTTNGSKIEIIYFEEE